MGSAGLTHLWLGWPLIGMLRLMSRSVEWIQSWPGAVIEPVVLSPVQVGLLYAVIISLFMMLVIGLRKWIFGLAGLLILFFFNVFVNDYQRFKTCEITVYHIPGYKAIDFVHNHKAIFVTDMDVVRDKAKIDFHINPHRNSMGVREVINMHTDSGIVISLPGAYMHYPFFLFHGKKVIIMDKKSRLAVPVDFSETDLLVLSAQQKNNQDILPDSLPDVRVVVDASMPKYRLEQCKSMLEARGLHAHIVGESGAFTMQW